jgi:hypothetical protein
MREKEIGALLQMLLSVYSLFIKTIVVIVLLLSFIMLLSQTSFCPLNLRLLADYSFETTLAVFRPYKTAFPKPLEIETED